MSEDQDTEDIPGLPEEDLDLGNSQFTKRKKKANLRSDYEGK